MYVYNLNYFRVDVQMQEFSVTGVQQGEFIPQLVTSQEVTQDIYLLNVVFETNPLGKVVASFRGSRTKFLSSI